jgi:hypothetical protein
MWIEIQNTDWVNRLTYAMRHLRLVIFARFSSLVLMGTVCMHYAFIARCAPTIDVFRVSSIFRTAGLYGHGVHALRIYRTVCSYRRCYSVLALLWSSNRSEHSRG